MQNALHKCLNNCKSLKALAQISFSISFFFVIGLNHSFAQINQQLSKKIDLNLKNASLQESLSDIENKSGLFFNVERDVLTESKSRINLQQKNIETKKAIEQILDQTGLKYKIVNQSIVIGRGVNEPKKVNKKQTLQKPGSISGKITDNENKEPIYSATFSIAGKSIQSDTAGNYSIQLEPGEYKGKITIQGYAELIVDKIKVTSGKNLILDLSLQRSSDYISTVTVTALQVIETGTSKAVIDEMRLARAVVSGIGKEQISRSQDRDAAEVVRRIPGVSIFDNKFIVVRGLAQRYNSVLLNNALAPSFEPDSRAFSFDILPSSMIDRVIIYKSASAELPGDFAGGAVKIYTTGMPTKNSFNFNFASSYNQNTTFQQFFEQPQGKLTWLSYDDGTYQMPKEAGEVINRYERRAKHPYFNQNWNALPKTAPSDLRINLDGSRRFQLSDHTKLGIIGAMSYSNTYQNDRVSRNVGNFSVEDQEYIPEFNFIDQLFSHNIRLNGLLNSSIHIGNNHQIDFKNLYTHMAEFEYNNRNGVAGLGITDGTGLKPEDLINQLFLENNFREIYSSQLNGNHRFFNKLNLNWFAGYTWSLLDQPDLRRRTRIAKPGFEEGGQPNFIEPVGTPEQVNFIYWNRIYRTLPEKTKTLGFNISQTFEIGNFHPVVKAGMYAEDKTRDFQMRILGLVYQTIDENQDGKPDNEQLMGEDSHVWDKYAGTNTLRSGYLLAELPILKRLNLTAGLRLEHNIQEMLTADETRNGQEMTIRNDLLTWLPSFNLSYDINKSQLIRAAYSKTLNRAEFREIAAFYFFDMRAFTYNYGNPKIIPQADIHNIDLRYEWYPGAGETVSIGTFYKHFSNPIEFFYYAAASGYNNYMWGNAAMAVNYGAELDVTLSLARFTSKQNKFLRPLERMSLLFNAAIIHSKITLDKGVNDDISFIQKRNRPLMGQSPYTINAGLNYNHHEIGLMANLSYNIIGRRIVNVGNKYNPDVYDSPKNLLDFSLSQRIKKHYELKLGIQNILNARNLQIQDSDGNGKFKVNDGPYNTWRDNKFYSWYDGTTFTLGIGLKL